MSEKKKNVESSGKMVTGRDFPFCILDFTRASSQFRVSKMKDNKEVQIIFSPFLFRVKQRRNEKTRKCDVT